ncbi:hypothetical protein T459_00140 [Capsicum annuum]|uniref:GDSL esterase/lipase n=1 Tax=Capsicum annuum TaxID=4072 RepID=A0A2G3ADJ8_CAPAN|nr:hypothetical protein T459_00140 [Capsicum annuum]
MMFLWFKKTCATNVEIILRIREIKLDIKRFTITNIEEMILGIDYASAGTGIIFSSSSELGQHIEQVIDTGQEFILNNGDDATTLMSSNSVFYISLESNNCVYFYEGCCGFCEYKGWIICNSPEMACHKELVLFVIGDSSVDCRTNNFLGTFARVDRLSYGHDFDIHQPTGRFCNGRIPVDYLVSRLGLPFVPSYLGQAGSTEEMILGVNYASAGAGIIFSSGSELGQHISLAQQIVFIQGQHISLAQQIGDDATSNLISSSVFYISIGSNVYIQYYLLNVSNDQSVYLPWSFNQFLAQTIKQEIKNLYNAKVRKVVVMGLAPIGWAPDYLGIYSSKNGECLVTINDMILEFNFAVRYMVSGLNEVLVDSSIIFCDAFEGSMDIIQNHDRYGFNVTDEACCGLGEYKGWIMCVSPEMACNNASSHIWWDQFHPTSAVNRILADNVWSSLHTPSGTQ